ncbi:MAG: ComF family protein [Lachnospiraceae bacterium]|nr:ComF family protein [Lachnospiraceae bacterium]
MVISAVYNAFLDIVFPRICPVCNSIVDRFGADICRDCERRLSFVGDSYCMRCGKPVDESEEYCSDCERMQHVYDEGRSVLVYDELSSKSIYRFKYSGKREFAGYYGRIIHERLSRKIKSWDPDVIVPVPIHKSRLKIRGYNQAALIAGQLSKRTGIPVDYTAVYRTVATGMQKKLDAAQRQNNLKKAFIASGNVVKYKSALIVDDIYTTGATIDAVSAALKDGGIKKVYFVTLCIGRGS